MYLIGQQHLEPSYYGSRKMRAQLQLSFKLAL